MSDIGELKMLPVAGGRLACHVAGHGPPVILLHTSLTDSRLWTHEIDGLREAYLTIAIDQRGHGRSSDPVGPYDPARDIEDVLGALDVRDAVIVGFEDGAEWAVRVATGGRVDVKALVLASPKVGWLAWQFDVTEASAGASAGLESVLTNTSFEPLLDAMASRDADAIADWMGRAPGVLTEGHPSRALLKVMARDSISGLFQQDAVLPADPALTKRLEQLTIPVLVMAPEGEPQQRWARELVGRLKRGTLVRLPTRMEFVNLELPGCFNSALVGFLREVGLP